MGKRDRRDKVALDEAYSFYRKAVVEETNIDLHSLVNSLKTVDCALASCQGPDIQLTTRLWLRIQQALFDKLITTCPGHLVWFRKDGSVVEAGKEFPEDGTLEFHPEGLKRNDDVFTMPVKEIHPMTLYRLNRVWKDRGADTRKEDFGAMPECTGDVCIPKPFAVGHELLVKEAESGKQKAYRRWWELYWQAYCTADTQEQSILETQMSKLEAVWGNLYY